MCATNNVLEGFNMIPRGIILLGEYLSWESGIFISKVMKVKVQNEEGGNWTR